MKLKLLLARWFASRIQERTRLDRRAFRDYSRHELDRIRGEEIRARGLRLYAAWSTPRFLNVVQTDSPNWQSTLQTNISILK
jgi:hypothetical protein